MQYEVEFNCDISLYELFQLDDLAYDYIKIEDCGFSQRICNICRRNDIHYLDQLLLKTINYISNLKNMGRKSVEEIIAWCLIEKEKTDIEKYHNDLKKVNYKNVIDCLKSNIDKVVLEDYDFFYNCNLDEEEFKIVEKYKDAHEILGSKLVVKCIENPNTISPIVNMFSDFQYRVNLYNEIHKYVVKIPNSRLYKKAAFYIDVFSSSEKERKILNEYCRKSNFTIKNIINYVISKLYKADYNIDREDIELLINFFDWLSFDVEDKIENIFQYTYIKENYRYVINQRSQNKTLEEVGESSNVTRERVRQIERKALIRFESIALKLRLVNMLKAELNNIPYFYYSDINGLAKKHTAELLYFLTKSKICNLKYDGRLDLYTFDEDNFRKIYESLNYIGDFIDENHLDNKIHEISMITNLPESLIYKAFFSKYKKTGKIYHNHRLKITTICRDLIGEYFPYGFKINDSKDLTRLKNLIQIKYGDSYLPATDHALIARVSDVCINCDRGTYILKKDKYMSPNLKADIYDYIINCKDEVILPNTLFMMFKDRLINEGIDNKFYLIAVLKELFKDKLSFTRDYIYKTKNNISFRDEVKSFIKKSDIPVTKEEIKIRYPGITEIVINMTIADKDILNYFGEYFYAKNIFVSDEENKFLFETINNYVSDGNAHHVNEIYQYINNFIPEVFTRNFVKFTFSAYSLLEYLYMDKFNFSRPYIAKKGLEIASKNEMLNEFITSRNEIKLDEISDFIKERSISVNSFLDLINSYNDRYLLVNSNTIMSIDKIGINKEIANSVDEIISTEISKTIPINKLTCWNLFPSIKINWNEWLVYSVINRWGSKTIASTSSNRFIEAIPLISPYDNYDPNAFKDMKRVCESDHEDNYDDIFDIDIDDLFVDAIMEEEGFGDEL